MYNNFLRINGLLAQQLKPILFSDKFQLAHVPFQLSQSWILLLNCMLVLTFAQARALLEWHNISRFCGHCGEKTVPMEAGRRKQCSNALCKKRIYPRVDPVQWGFLFSASSCIWNSFMADYKLTVKSLLLHMCPFNRLSLC